MRAELTVNGALEIAAQRLELVGVCSVVVVVIVVDLAFEIGNAVPRVADSIDIGCLGPSSQPVPWAEAA